VGGTGGERGGKIESSRMKERRGKKQGKELRGKKEAPEKVTRQTGKGTEVRGEEKRPERKKRRGQETYQKIR